ncbi:uncharacterized protein I303_107265 [Kwoniella dejecticola CBS 10117]|uniref:Uncharacterized protein n=1 Tax=Kwoniella dejecticola CBS 10117 TaxID=1296121 RepID=A0A1A5ZZ73_9TREE|nr:uncharacterized protein I303_06667 [Kwoniella dejecticola CBS 10117]OBR83108.1 hypothetical protein I303_06667 [Kwoniella dejecticola CBS 10117]
MNDPLSPLTAPPPRYLLESDSSDEEGQGTYPTYEQSGPSKPKIRLNNESQVSIEGVDKVTNLEEVVIGIGQAGKYVSKLAESQGQGLRIGNVKIGSKNIGGVLQGTTDGHKIISLEEGELSHEESWEVVKVLIDTIKARKWIIVTSYVPSMYIPSSSERSQRLSEPPIRILSPTASTNDYKLSEVDGVRAFDAPNYLTGIAGGIVSLASHPSTTIPSPKTILLPLPLSSLAPSKVSAALSGPGASSAFSVRSGQSRIRWTEDDDEPYSAPGMGRVKGLKRGLEDISSMYM